MSPSERIFHRQYGAELLRLAQEDLKVAEVLAKTAGIRGETTLFLVQQAVEKALKAVLCAQGRPVPMTHDLLAVVQRFDPSDIPPGGEALQDLTPYATVRRYEEGTFQVTAGDLSAGIQLAVQTIAWAQKKVAS